MINRVSIIVVVTSIALLSSCSFGSGPLPQGYAIVYGVSDYAPAGAPLPIGANYDLNFGDDDATDVAAMLTDQGYIVTLRTDTAATSAQMRLDFASVSAAATEDSRFAFFYAGHGLGDGMEGVRIGEPGSEWAAYYDTSGSTEPTGRGAITDYMVLYDAFTDITDPTLSISDDQLAVLVAGIPSRQKVVIIDACHSGGFIGDGSSTDSVPGSFDGENEGVSVIDALGAMTLYLNFGTQGAADISENDAVVIAAAGEQEFSYEYNPAMGIPHGIFTYYLLQAPQLADRNYDGYVTVSEAYDHACRAIMSIENQFLFGDYKFVPRVTGGAVDFVLFEAR